MCVLGLLLAQLFARPIRRLTDGVRRVAAGDYEAEIPVTPRDELGDLARAFNEMSRSLQVKSDLVEEQQAENQRLLLSIMPEDLAQRYREGEDGLAHAHPNVTVLYAEISGFADAGADLSPERSAGLIGELLGNVDAAAEQAGVDKMRTTSTGYLASCGVVVPRIDHARRMVGFAQRMIEITHRFNLTHPRPAPAHRHRHRRGDRRPARPVQARVRHLGKNGQRRQQRPHRRVRRRVRDRRRP